MNYKKIIFPVVFLAILLIIMNPVLAASTVFPSKSEVTDAINLVTSVYEKSFNIPSTKSARQFMVEIAEAERELGAAQELYGFSKFEINTRGVAMNNFVNSRISAALVQQKLGFDPTEQNLALGKLNDLTKVTVIYNDKPKDYKIGAIKTAFLLRNYILPSRIPKKIEDRASWWKAYYTADSRATEEIYKRSKHPDSKGNAWIKSGTINIDGTDLQLYAGNNCPVSPTSSVCIDFEKLYVIGTAADNNIDVCPVIDKEMILNNEMTSSYLDERCQQGSAFYNNRACPDKFIETSGNYIEYSYYSPLVQNEIFCPKDEITYYTSGSMEKINKYYPPNPISVPGTSGSSISSFSIAQNPGGQQKSVHFATNPQKKDEGYRYNYYGNLVEASVGLGTSKVNKILSYWDESNPLSKKHNFLKSITTYVTGITGRSYIIPESWDYYTTGNSYEDGKVKEYKVLGTKYTYTYDTNGCGPKKITTDRFIDGTNLAQSWIEFRYDIKCNRILAFDSQGGNSFFSYKTPSYPCNERQCIDTTCEFLSGSPSCAGQDQNFCKNINQDYPICDSGSCRRDCSDFAVFYTNCNPSGQNCQNYKCYKSVPVNSVCSYDLNDYVSAKNYESNIFLFPDSIDQISKTCSNVRTSCSDTNCAPSSTSCTSPAQCIDPQNPICDSGRCKPDCLTINDCSAGTCSSYSCKSNAVSGVFTRWDGSEQNLYDGAVIFKSNRDNNECDLPYASYDSTTGNIIKDDWSEFENHISSTGQDESVDIASMDFPDYEKTVNFDPVFDYAQINPEEFNDIVPPTSPPQPPETLYTYDVFQGIVLANQGAAEEVVTSISGAAVAILRSITGFVTKITGMPIALADPKPGYIYKEFVNVMDGFATEEEYSLLTTESLNPLYAELKPVIQESQLISQNPCYNTPQPQDNDSDRYLEISSCCQLQLMKDNLNANYELSNDIDCSETRSWNNGLGFDPVGSKQIELYIPPFSGNFNGNNHSIYNLYIKSGAQSCGLFGYITEKTNITNVGLIDANITGTGIYIGGLVGSVMVQSQRTNCTIKNSYVTGSVTRALTSTYYSYLGGLTGAFIGTIQDSYSKAKVSLVASSRGEAYTGGLVGDIDGQIINSYSTGNISALSPTSIAVGGITGKLTRGTIKNSFAAGSIYGSGKAGGLAGIKAGTILNSQWYDFPGDSATICYYGEASDTNCIKQTDIDYFKYDFSGKELFKYWNFTTTWGSYLDYPCLLGEPLCDKCISALPTKIPYNGIWYGLGTAENPFKITNCTQLQNISKNLTAYFNLFNNINCSETRNWNCDSKGCQGFRPIGNLTAPFIGVFNGQGYTIINLFINRTYFNTGKTVVWQGLFGVTGAGSKIKNLGLTDINITSNFKVGGLVGSSAGGEINNCSVTGNINAFQWVGGLVGMTDTAITNITDCYAKINIQSSSNSGSIGGLVGLFNQGTILNSYTAGSINAPRSSYIGGIVGANRGILLNSFSTVNISGYIGVGGLVGRLGAGNITKSFYNNYTGNNYTCVGQFDIPNLYSNCIPIQNNPNYFFIKTNPPINNWDFTDIWQSSIYDYPIFVWQEYKGHKNITQGFEDGSFGDIVFSEHGAEIINYAAVGNKSLRMPYADRAEAVKTVTVDSGGGTLSFYWMPPSEVNNDRPKTELYIDDNLILTRSGNQWYHEIVPLSTGTREIKWKQYTLYHNSLLDEIIITNVILND